MKLLALFLGGLVALALIVLLPLAAMGLARMLTAPPGLDQLVLTLAAALALRPSPPRPSPPRPVPVVLELDDTELLYHLLRNWRAA